MKKLIFLSLAIISFTFCKGPRTGPLVKESFDKTEQSNPMAGKESPGPVQTEKVNITLEPCEGCIRISDLFADKNGFSGKVIRIKGIVRKFNPEIMGKNWVHIQDGTEFEGGYDLTITTNQMVSLDETVTFEGKIVLNKDFGYGYFYNILMEDAKPVL
jgi:predicted RNA-binding protein